MGKNKFINKKKILCLFENLFNKTHSLEQRYKIGISNIPQRILLRKRKQIKNIGNKTKIVRNLLLNSLYLRKNIFISVDLQLNQISVVVFGKI